MRSLVAAALMLLPLALSAQTKYSDSLFSPGLDPAHTEPLTQGENFKIHALRAIGPRSLLFDAVNASLNEWKDDPSVWGRGADGVARRFGSQAGRNGVREMLGFGSDAVLHTDPRIYRSTHTRFGSRLLDALSQVVITRTDAGGHAPAFANVGSAFAAGQMQTVWMPRNDSHFKDGLVNAGVMLMGDAFRDVAREFWPDVRRKLHHSN